MMRYILYFCLPFFFMSCKATHVNLEKVNGVSYVASKEGIADKHVEPLLNLNANYAAIMPFGFVKGLNSSEVYYNSKKQWYGETLEGAKQYIEQLQQKQIKIMLKPQIWVWRGEFTGNIEMDSEADWKAFETSYSKFILDYAQLAQDNNIDIFCIGTELEMFINQRPEYWFSLINNIKAVYNGKLIYAANWDEFRRTPFWKELDFIGIDAYFPVSISKTPSVEDCKQGWEKHKEIIKTVSKNNNRSVLFTEYGYRSVDFSGKEPWKSYKSMNQVNLEAQTNTTQALFEMFWDEPWFSGGFLWKWHHNHEHVGGEEDSQFTPQNKPAEHIVREVYFNN